MWARFYIAEQRTICLADQNHCVTSLLLLFTYSRVLHINSSCEIFPDSLILENEAYEETRPCNWAKSVSFYSLGCCRVHLYGFRG